MPRTDALQGRRSYDSSVERRRVPPLVIDLLIAVGLLVVSLMGRSRALGSEFDHVFLRDPDGWNILFLVLQSMPLALRRRYPIPVLAITLLAFGFDRALDYPATFAGAGPVIALHAVGTELPRQRSAQVGWPIVALLGTFTLLGAVLYESVAVTDVVFVFFVAGLALHLGREVHQRRAHLQELELRAERAEREREERARQAVGEERARIARELHDIVAHQMAVMTVQAEGAARLAGDADPRVAGALKTIRETGHEGLAEMRNIVGILRTGSDPALPLEPSAGLDRLQRLAQQMGAAGLEVELEVKGAPTPLPSVVDLGAYRVVQESLTNTLRHGGPGARALVTIDYRDDTVEVRVSDDGRGAASGGDGSGQGVIGMRERVVLLGGEFAAGPKPGGGFEVKASIPVAE